MRKLFAKSFKKVVRGSLRRNCWLSMKRGFHEKEISYAANIRMRCMLVGSNFDGLLII